MSNQQIVCRNSTEFMDAVLACVKRGLTFRADAGTFTIHLTGGY